jgi:hypothetical protein
MAKIMQIIIAIILIGDVVNEYPTPHQETKLNLSEGIKLDRISSAKNPKTTGLKIGEPFHSIKNLENTMKAMTRVVTRTSIDFAP